MFEPPNNRMAWWEIALIIIVTVAAFAGIIWIAVEVATKLNA